MTHDLEKLTDEEIVFLCATEVMGWEDPDGQWWCPKCEDWVHPAQVSFAEVHRREGCGEPVQPYKDHEASWNPLTSWDAWRQVEERLLVDNILTLAFFRYCKRGDSTKSFVENYMQADLRTRCRAALKAVRSSKPV